YFAVMSAAHGCRVLGFEPNPKPRAYALASIDLNAVSHLVTIVAAGMNHQRGHGKMVHDFAWGLGGVSAVPSAGGAASTGKVIEFPLVPLADAVREHALLIKVDTEGHEASVFANTSEAFFQRHGADNILVEIKQFNSVEKREMMFNILTWGQFAAVYVYAEMYARRIDEVGDVFQKMLDVTGVVRSKKFDVKFQHEDLGSAF
ncbi:hypothetical protein FOA52_008422, partial [Chlamydomonas sp. UWO 241]